MKKFISNYWPLLSLVLLASVARMMAWLFLPSFPVSTDWTHFYHPAAAALANGENLKNFSSTLNITPIYISYLSIFYRLFEPGIFAMRLGHLLLDVLIVVQIYFFGEKLFGKKQAVLAAILYSIYPTVVYMAGLGQPEILLGFVLMMAIYVWHYADQKNSWKAYLILGILFGLSILIKPNYFGLIPFLIILEILFSKNKQQTAKMLFAISFGFISIATPWLFYRTFLDIANLSVFQIYAKIIYFGTTLRPSFDNGRMLPLQIFYQQQTLILGDVSSLLQISFKILEKWAQLIWPNPFKLLEFLVCKFYQIWFATDAGNADQFLRYFQIPLMIFTVAGIFYSFRGKESFLKQKGMFLIILYTISALMFITPLHRELLPVMPIISLYVANFVLTIFNIRMEQ